MSDRVYKRGLIVIGLVTLVLIPLTAMQTVPPALGLAAFVAVAVWIFFRLSTMRRSQQKHDVSSH